MPNARRFSWMPYLCALLLPVCAAATADAQNFIRGDYNCDGRVDVADGEAYDDYFNAGGPPPACEKAADVNADGVSLSVADFVLLLRYLAGEIPTLPEPFPGCGTDTSPLPCDANCCNQYFIRGDYNCDGIVDDADGEAYDDYFNAGGPPPPCEKAADVNADGVSLSVADLVLLLRYLAGEIPTLPEPFPECGTDTSSLPCGVSCCDPDLPCQPGFDTDGDGLYDDWECFGYDADGDGSIDVDLPAMGADPNHKDIFVEVDWMVAGPGETLSHFFRSNSRTLAVNMFANAPVSNPDGINGITLHIDVGQGGAFTGGNSIPHDNDLNPVVLEFLTLKLFNFDPNRQGIFHYCIFGHQYSGGTSGGLSFGIPACDFIVTIGAWPSNPGTSILQSAFFSHELGHNLGLFHGGNDTTNYKPNYLSLMNYWFAASGLIVNGLSSVMDYSRWELPWLVESALFETGGVVAQPGNANYSSWYRCGSSPICAAFTIPSLNQPVDWDCDGAIANLVGSDINYCDGVMSTLTGYDDWSNLIYNCDGVQKVAISDNGQASIPAPIRDITYEEYSSFAIWNCDMNDDDVLDVLDVVELVEYTFRGGSPPIPLYRASCNCDDVIDVLDVVTLVDHAYRGGPLPCW